jgi:hypothetical protein
MGTSIFIARVIGIFFLVTGIAGLVRRHTFLEMIAEFARSPIFIFFSGFVTLIIGAILVVVHNVWVLNWTLAVTLIAWLALLTSFLRISFPENISHFAGKILLHPQYQRLIAVILLLIGIYFLYFGFWA